MHLFLNVELQPGKPKEFNMNGWNYRSKVLLKAIFCHQKGNKKEDRLYMNFFFNLNSSVQRCLYPLFRSQCSHFMLSLLFWKLSSENYLNSQVRINKMVNKHTVDYHPSSSQLTSKIYPLRFLCTPRGFIFSESFLNFFLNLYIPPWLQKSLKFMVKITGKYILSQKIEFVHLYSCLQAKLSSIFSSLPPGRRNLPIPPKQHFLKI